MWGRTHCKGIYLIKALRGLVGRVIALFLILIVVVVPQHHAFFKITELYTNRVNFSVYNLKIKQKQMWEGMELCR